MKHGKKIKGQLDREIAAALASKRRPGKLTPASLGLADDVKLSVSYANSRTNFKTVSDVIIGRWLAGAGAHRADLSRRDLVQGTRCRRQQDHAHQLVSRDRRLLQSAACH